VKHILGYIHQLPEKIFLQTVQEGQFEQSIFIIFLECSKKIQKNLILNTVHSKYYHHFI